MSKHAADTASTTKKFLAAGGLAFGVASLGLFAVPAPPLPTDTRLMTRTRPGRAQ